jgi:hypothetical protein
MNTSSAGLRTYQGSCHCGAVRLEVAFDASVGTSRCNCTFCTKNAWWGLHVKPEAFRVLSGQEVLRAYSRSPQGFAVQFCSVCGTSLFGHGHVAELGGAFCGVNVPCLDDLDPSGIQVTYFDGLHDTWATFAVKPYVSPFSA